MKRTLLVAFLLLIAATGFSQLPTVTGLYVGAGCATKDNYDVAPSVGFTYSKFLRNGRATLGADLFYQTYSLYYDHEANTAKHGAGVAGAIVRNASSYAFVTPKVEYYFGSQNRLTAYVTCGAGFKVGGFDSLRKWDHSYGNPSVNNFDSSLDNSKNMNGLLFRVGAGFKQYLQIAQNWHLVFIEDFGLLASSLTKNDITNPSRTPYTPQRLSPGYISLQIGIFHCKTVTPLPKAWRKS